MDNRLSRLFLALSAAILFLGCVMHTSAFKKAVAAAASSNLPRFFANSLKALWLIDSATMAVLAITFTLIALKPVMARRSIIILLGLIPLSTSILLYTFIGMFIPAHMMLMAAIFVFVAGLLL